MSSLDITPPLGPTELAAGHAPPTPPHENPLDDIYGSAPTSPTLASHDPQASNTSYLRPHEILSDLPSRQRALDTDAYREGLSVSKGQYVQEGFDEGYSLGANLGLQVGYINGVLHGFVAALSQSDNDTYKAITEVYEAAQKELVIEQLLGKSWVDEEGIWKWDVRGGEEDPTFREVAEQHPVVKKWIGVVEELAEKYGVDLKAVEKMQGPHKEEEDD